MQENPHLSPFEAIRHEDEDGNEYWSARELYKLLGYSRWEKFQTSIEEAQTACKQSGQAVADHFHLQVKMVKAGVAPRPREDYKLSRYACYLLVQNSDPSKPVVALGQTYFAVQTRRQELADELATLPEDQKRIIYRSQMAIFNTRLAEAAQQAGVVEPIDFAIFQDHGYRGLYTLSAKQIHQRKGLGEGQQILDYMGSEELGANIFRATQTEAKLRREGITGKERANQTHYQVGRKVRQTIEELGGTTPEHLPTPAESMQELERKEQQRLKRSQQLQKQPPLIDKPDGTTEETT
jgi:DNA-damage-inducible protein D